MSIESQNRRNNYVGANNNNIYDYNFKLFDQDHIEVSVRNLTTGEKTDLVLTTDYTVQFVNDTEGGTITLVDAGQEWLDDDGYLDSNFALSLLLAPTLEQRLDIKNNAEYYPISHERQFDKLFQIILYQQDQLDRAIKLDSSIDTEDFTTNLPADILVNGAGKFLAVNSDGTGLELRDGTEGSATDEEVTTEWTPGIQTVSGTPTYTDRYARAVKRGKMVYVNGYMQFPANAGSGLSMALCYITNLPYEIKTNGTRRPVANVLFFSNEGVILGPQVGVGEATNKILCTWQNGAEYNHIVETWFSTTDPSTIEFSMSYETV
jgi:hypothetical protein